MNLARRLQRVLGSEIERCGLCGGRLRTLAGVLAEGSKRRERAFAGAHPGEARTLLGAVEAAMLVAHSNGDVSRFNAATRRLLAELQRSL